MTNPESPLLRAYLAIERLEARLRAAEQAQNEPIAVIGLGCRFPGGANDPESYWNLLREGRDAVREIPADRWDADAFFDPDPEVPGRMYTRHAGFLDRVDGFDAGFFGISPREATSLDPQQRLLLEVSWEALENAGVPADRLVRSRTGMFIGLMSVDYSRLLTASDAYTATGNDFSFAAGRLSYALGLQGPCLTVATACSSSLVAVHLACQSLRAGECRLALAGGVSLMLSPATMVTLCRLRALAPDGRSKTFDAAADGYGRGEGCGIVVLKRLSDALADGDPVVAVLRGSAVNHDGPSGGLTIPSGPAQQAVIREALSRAGVEPSRVDYLEAHGTGTALGDPIEVHAAAAVLGPGRSPDRPLWLGSAKTNFGHLEAAAGVAGLIKAILALRHREIPPHLHLRRPNPHIAWADLPVAIATGTARPWPEPESGPRLAGVSSFSLSGVNAHVVVEEGPAPASIEPADDRSCHLLTLSARGEEALREMAGRYARRLAEPGVSLADVAYSAGVGRARLPHRLAVVAATAAEAAEALSTPAEGMATGRVDPQGRPRLAFLFTGQGSHYAGMGRGLYTSWPVFRRALERCDELLRPHLGAELGPTPLLSLLFEAPPEGLERTDLAQPALFALGWSLAELWRSWGVEPDAVLGHSLGEYTAACVAGVLSLEEALPLVAERGRLMQALPPGGAMAAVFAPEERVRTALASRGGAVEVAALNGDEDVVVSGDAGTVAALLEELAAAGVRSKPLAVSHAFHSRRMEPALETLERAVSRLPLALPRLPLIANLTGRAAGPEVAAPSSWRRHAREPVRFADGVRALRDQGVTIFLEIGPAPALVAMARRILGDDGVLGLPSLRRGRDDGRTILESLAALFVRGFDVDQAGLEAGTPRRRVPLPTYPFQRRRYWLEAAPRPEATPPAGSVHPLLGRRLRSPLAELLLEARLAADLPSFLADHRVFGRPIVPAAAWLEMAGAAAALRLQGPLTVEDAVFREPLTLEEGEARTVQTVLTQAGDGALSFQIFSQPEGADEEGWTLHATGRVRTDDPGHTALPFDLGALRQRCPEPLDAGAHTAGLRERGIDYGPAFQGLTAWWRGDGEALGEVVAPAELAGTAGAWRFHPALLDACLQALAGALRSPDESTADGAWLPLAVERFRLQGHPGERLVCHARLRPEASGEVFTGDLWIWNAGGEPVAEVEGLRLKRAGAEAFLQAAGRDVGSWLYEVSWKLQPLRGVGLPAGFFPAPDALAAQLRPTLAEIGRRHDLEHYRALLPELEAVATSQATQATAALRRLGGEVAPQHRRLFGRVLEIAGDAADSIEPAARLDALLQVYPAAAAEIGLLARCGDHLAEVLRGEADPLELLFPRSAASGAEGLYRDSPFAQALNDLVAGAVDGLLEDLPAGRLLRVLEVGAGTGGTTGAVLSRLPAGRFEYLFTDVSPLFLSQAEGRFGDREGFACRLLDLELDPGAQGFEDGSFDLVVAANVLHATADLRRSLRHVRRLLAPGGVLLLIEGTRPQRWLDLVFGLTEGWWRFQDTDLRSSHPLLGRSAWLDLFREYGFAGAVALPDEADGPSEQALFVARADDRVAGPAAGDRDLWLVLADPHGIGQGLADRLAARGSRCLLLDPEAGTSRETFRQILDPATVRSLAGVVHLWSLAGTPPVEATVESLGRDQDLGCASALHVVQALIESRSAARLWLVTRGVHSVPGDHGARAVASAPLWGLGKVVALEHPELACTRVDLDPAASVEEAADALFAEIGAGGREDQVALRRGGRRVARLIPASPAAPAESFRLELTGRGVLDNLSLRPAERRPPGPGEVEIRVHASGLNFLDVMNTLDLLPLGGTLLGAECAGRVLAVGSGVEGLAPGDPVVAIAAGSFASHVTTDARLVARLPPGLGFEEAATLPIAFLTVHYALRHHARLRPGDRVLIHAAAGGVGLAAVQIARRAGATVIATAGSPAKRRFLASLGVTDCLDSRSLSFVQGVRDLTDGAGVDVVLSSLAGDFIPASLSVLAPGGRFLEIGKTGVWSPERVAAERPDVSYVVYDLLGHVKSDPGTVGAALRDLVAEVAAGDLAPLPLRAFPPDEAVEAFRLMQQARHIGKIVIAQPAAAAPEGPFAPRPDATCLVTGGLGGIGLRVAAWLAERGARSLVLAGRSTPGPEALETIARLESAGTAVRAVQVDVADPGQVSSLLAAVRAELPPLAGVFHAAGVLEDGVLQQQDWERFRRVLAPKVQGAWNLHAGTAGDRLDTFVLFSSAASVLGSSGQANHAAANAFLDTLAWHRRALGLPAVSVNWGAWSEIGAAAARHAGERVGRRGLGEIAPAQGLEALERALAHPQPQIAVLPVDWSRFLRPFAPGTEPPFFAEMVRRERASAPVADAAPAVGSDLRRELAEAGAGERRPLLARFLRRQATRVLGLDPSQPIDGRQPLGELGLDSLMAVEMRNALGLAVGAPLPATLLFDHPTLDALADYLAREVLGLGTGAGRAAEPAEEETTAAEVEQLSEDQLDDLLADFAQRYGEEDQTRVGV
jgi:acyl transferase domain-containing protein/NADPH:quinone reductase-like Zn-dependent oxidoreductase